MRTAHNRWIKYIFVLWVFFNDRQICLGEGQWMMVFILSIHFLMLLDYINIKILIFSISNMTKLCLYLFFRYSVYFYHFTEDFRGLLQYNFCISHFAYFKRMHLIILKLLLCLVIFFENIIICDKFINLLIPKNSITPFILMCYFK